MGKSTISIYFYGHFLWLCLFAKGVEGRICRSPGGPPELPAMRLSSPAARRWKRTGTLRETGKRTLKTYKKHGKSQEITCVDILVSHFSRSKSTINGHVLLDVFCMFTRGHGNMRVNPLDSGGKLIAQMFALWEGVLNAHTHLYIYIYTYVHIIYVY